jgi:hypothetical protein
MTKSTLSSSRGIPSSIFLCSRIIFELDFKFEISSMLCIFRLDILLKTSFTLRLFSPFFLFRSLNSFGSAFETFLTVSENATLKKS